MPAAGEIEYVTTLSPEILERAAKDLNEDAHLRNQSVTALREWLKKQPHLSSIPTGEEKFKLFPQRRSFSSNDVALGLINLSVDSIFLLNYLRGCKYSLEKAKQKIDLAFTLRNALPEFFSGWDPMQPEMQEALKLG